MDPKTIEEAKRVESDWQRVRTEIELEWHIALHEDAPDLVPSKLEISIPPIRHAA